MDTQYNQEGQPQTLYAALRRNGVNFATGVPCGVLRNTIALLSKDAEVKQVTAQNEPEAVGIATGAFLGGKNPALYMQNSGFLKSTNEYGSLLIPCHIPILNIVSFRGCEGETAPQHFVNGQITLSTLRSMGIFHEEMRPDDFDEQIRKAYSKMHDSSLPAVILVKRELYNQATPTAADLNKIARPDLSHEFNIIDLYRDGFTMSREGALEEVLRQNDMSGAIISTTGLISRSLYEHGDTENQFYNTGSFGLASSIGLGLALSAPNLPVLVVDGDGSALTNSGSIITIGHERPENLTHLVLDNNQYGSCSGERSCSDTAKLHLLASICGYREVYIVNDSQGLETALKKCKDTAGPHFILSQIIPGGRRDFKRPENLPELTRRFRKYVENTRKAKP